MVETHARSIASRRAGCAANRKIRRLLISVAAFSVNVMARIRAGSTDMLSTSHANRSVNTRVFPEPGPATTQTFWPERSTALRWSSESIMRALGHCQALHATNVAIVAPPAFQRIRRTYGDITRHDRFM